MVSKRHCYLLLAATTLTYLIVTMGGLVCATESGRGCPDWPGCYGRLVPMMKIDSIIEFLKTLQVLRPGARALVRLVGRRVGPLCGAPRGDHRLPLHR